MAAASKVPGTIIRQETVPAGGRWSDRLETGERLRIVDLHGQQAVDFLCFSAELPVDRYNAANTIKLAKTIYLGKGVTLYSDRARPLMRIIEDTCGRHDTLAGCCSAEMNDLRYGVPDTHACRRNFIDELSLWNLGPSELVANVNFFMNVPVEADGSIAIAPCISKPGDYVELVTEMPVIAALSNCPQRNNPCSGFEPTPIDVIVWRA